MPHPEQPTSRREARLAATAPGRASAASRAPEDLPRHALRRRARLRAVGAMGVVVALLIGVVAVIATARPSRGDGVAAPPAAPPAIVAPPVTALPVPSESAVPVASCDTPAVAAALSGGTDAEVIAAFGGAAAFRSAVATGATPCVNLADPQRIWVVVDKQRPLDPIDFEPASVIAPEGVQRTADVGLRPDAAAALTALVAAASDEGAGAIGLNSAYRSFSSQTRIYNGYVSSMGRTEADLQSARPGYSEHQTGLSADVAACGGGCGAIESFGGTPQGAWAAANAWRFGFVVRYEDGYTATTGYTSEPWHLRYIGTELAQAYHDGGYRTIEDFFGLPAAPTY